MKLSLVDTEVLPGHLSRGRGVILASQEHNLNGRMNLDGKKLEAEYGVKAMTRTT